MRSFFKQKKSPGELVQSTLRNITVFSEEKNDVKTKKASEKISSNLSQMKLIMYGDGDAEPKPDQIKKLCDEVFSNDLLISLVSNFQKFEFEARKDVAQIYNFVLRQRKEDAAKYVQDHPEILTILVKGYDETDIALNCGSILREVIRIESLNTMILNDKDLFSCFFRYVQFDTFDVASDAFGTFKQLLTKHAKSCATFLTNNFDFIFTKFDELLNSKNYVTKRQSLKLLGELLVSRANWTVMMKYINSPDNLKTMMNLLRGHTKVIQVEAFHVFKIFVANPKKSKPVLEILIRNKDKLIIFLDKFQAKESKDDDLFVEEKKMLRKALEKLDGSLPSDPARGSPQTPTAATNPTNGTATSPTSASTTTGPTTQPRASSSNDNCDSSSSSSSNDIDTPKTETTTSETAPTTDTTDSDTTALPKDTPKDTPAP